MSDENYIFLQKKHLIEYTDQLSNHTWKFEVDSLNHKVTIYKNGNKAKTYSSVAMPVSMTRLDALRQGL